jgi:hypothetical protein
MRRLAWICGAAVMALGGCSTPAPTTAFDPVPTPSVAPPVPVTEVAAPAIEPVVAAPTDPVARESSSRQARPRPVTRPAPAPEPGLIITPDERLTGRVVAYNQPGRFVVLNFPVGRLPALEQRLAVYREGLKVGLLRVTGPQRDDNIVADVVEGTALPGDEARDW